jgi:chromosome segregation ATPase
MRFLYLLLLGVIVALAGYGGYFYQNEYQPLLSAHETLQAQVTQLQNNTRQADEDKTELQRQLERLHKEQDVLGEKHKKQLSDLQLARDACTREKEQVLSARTAAEKQAESLSQKLAAQEDMLGELQQQQGGRLQELEQGLAQKDHLIQELQMRLAAMAKNSADKQTEKETLQKEVERLKPALQAAQSRVYILEQESQKTEQAFKTLQEQREQQLADMRQRLAEQAMHTQELQQRIGELSAASTRPDEDRAGKDKQISSLQSALREAQARIQALEQGGPSAHEPARG